METKKITQAGLIAALVFVATRYLSIGLPYGYVHLGDVILYVAAVVLGGPLGGLATAIGATLADFTSGYSIYAIPTFIIKFTQVLFVAKALDIFIKNKRGVKIMPTYLIICVISNIIMVSGYFFYELLLYGFAPALANIIPNCLQGITGAILSVFFLEAGLTVREKV